VEAGQDLFMNKLGCASCHAGGPTQRGAKLEGIFGKDVKLANGQTVKVDDEYLRESILNPSAKIVEGYQPIMPTFKGQVTEEQLMNLVAYIKSLSGVTGTTTTTSSSTSNSTTNTATTSTNAASNSNATTGAANTNRGNR
jgi:cytochrome c oxidase subunit 2